jgi:hypothetical protein
LRLSIAAIAVALVLPGVASAASPMAALICSEAVGQAQTGTIKGRLVWGGDAIPPVKMLEDKGKAEKDPQVCAKDQPILSRELVIDPQTKGVAYGFAYLSRPKGTSPEAIKEYVAKQPTVELDQKNCEFLPYVLTICEGQTLVVKASDPGINHNVRVTGFQNGANQNVPAGTELKLQLVPETRPIPLKCDIHPWMSGFLLVLDHPFSAATAKDGSFEIKGVPAGTQNLVLWQETKGYVNKGGGRGMPVTVKPGEVTDVGEIVLTPRQ